MEESEQKQTQVYPAPPPWFKLYRPDADGIAERPLPPLPPQPATEDYQVFGRMESVEAGMPPLTVKQLINVNPNGTVDFKRELSVLNKELLIQYMELVNTLVERPSSYGRGVEAISTILQNMHFLLNSLRSHQARASLEYILQTEADDRAAAISELRAEREKAVQLLDDYAQRLEQIGDQMNEKG